MLEATSITKTYTLPGKRQLTIFRGINLHVGEGELLTIVGASGSGKTTLLNILGTLDTPDSGSVRMDGKEICADGRYALRPKELARFRNRTIGFVFQFHHLLSDFTALENVAMAEFIGTSKLQPALARAGELLEQLGVSHRGDHLPSELSGGEQQRVAIARSLMNRPRLVLADEPSGNLDNQNSRNLYELMARLSRERRTSFVIVTHNTEFAMLSDRCLSMHEGILAAETTGGMAN